MKKRRGKRLVAYIIAFAMIFSMGYDGTVANRRGGTVHNTGDGCKCAIDRMYDVRGVWNVLCRCTKCIEPD